jgi:valyl-tRNA synthetase
MHSTPKRLAAQYALYEVLYRMLQLLAPVTPHVTEEIYQHMFKEHKGFESLQVSPWPKFNASMVDQEADKNGDLIISIIGEVRHDKAEKKQPLNAPIKNLTIYAGNEENAKILCSASGDVAGTLKASNIVVLAEKSSEGRQVGSTGVYVKIEYEAKA